MFKKAFVELKVALEEKREAEEELERVCFGIPRFNGYDKVEVERDGVRVLVERGEWREGIAVSVEPSEWRGVSPDVAEFWEMVERFGHVVADALDDIAAKNLDAGAHLYAEWIRNYLKSGLLRYF